MEKLPNGGYRCDHCGLVKDSHRAMKKHEPVCGHDDLSRIDGIENVDLSGEIPEFGTKETRQMKFKTEEQY